MIISEMALSLGLFEAVESGGAYCFVLHYSVTGYCMANVWVMVRYSVTALQCREDTPHPRKNKLYYIFIYMNIYKYII